MFCSVDGHYCPRNWRGYSEVGKINYGQRWNRYRNILCKKAKKNSNKINKYLKYVWHLWEKKNISLSLKMLHLQQLFKVIWLVQNSNQNTFPGADESRNHTTTKSKVNHGTAGGWYKYSSIVHFYCIRKGSRPNWWSLWWNALCTVELVTHWTWTIESYLYEPPGMQWLTCDFVTAL